MLKALAILLILPIASSFASAAESLKIAALHPLLGDMARHIGGDHVEVIDLLKPNGNLHTFEPAPKDIAQISGCRLILASGKNIEPYLDSLKDSVKNNTPPCTLIELGANIPDVSSTGHDEDHDHECEEGCHHGPVDPHWWHTPSNMKRAARTLTAEFSKLDPENAPDYAKNLAEWTDKMNRLDSWARVELSKIPRERRMLAMGHAAMNHFCKEYGFTELHVQGISREDEGNPAALASLLKKLRASHIPVIFPEYASNPKSLEEIAKSLNIKTAAPIITDGLAPFAVGFEAMFRYNVNTIVKGLCPPSDAQ